MYAYTTNHITLKTHTGFFWTAQFAAMAEPGVELLVMGVVAAAGTYLFMFMHAYIPRLVERATDHTKTSIDRYVTIRPTHILTRPYMNT